MYSTYQTVGGDHVAKSKQDDEDTEDRGAGDHVQK